MPATLRRYTGLLRQAGYRVGPDPDDEQTLLVQWQPAYAMRPHPGRFGSRCRQKLVVIRCTARYKAVSMAYKPFYLFRAVCRRQMGSCGRTAC
jgi:hypothetical protein